MNKRNSKIFKTASLISLIIILVIFAYFKFFSQNFIKPLGYGYKKNIVPSVSEVKNFALLDHLGNFFELYRNGDKEFIIFILQSNKCTYSTKKISEILKKHSPDVFSFYFINTDEIKSKNEPLNNLIKENINIPTLLDPSQSVSNQLDIKNETPFKIVSTRDWSYVQNNTANIKLQNLIAELNDVSKSSCQLTFTIHDKISYEKQIAPILIERCIFCHSLDGKIPPYFDSYEKIYSWKEMSQETIMTQRMPPISYDPQYGDVLNDISLENFEKQILIQWYKSGAKKDSLIDPIKSYQNKKKIPLLKKENLIYSTRMEQPHTIPPGGEIVYKFFQLGEAVPKDLWVKGYKTITTNRRQLHHESLFVASKPLRFYEKMARRKFGYIESEATRDHKDGDVANYISNVISIFDGNNSPDSFIKIQTYGAGKKEESFFPKGTNLFIPKGSYLILEKHYMGTGRVETEQSTLELYGSLNKPDFVKNIRSKIIGSLKFEIPANVKNYEVHTPYWSPKKNIKILTFLGHLHMRGKSVKIEVLTKEGLTKTIFSIPNFYYGWQTGAAIKLSTPIFVNSTDQLKAVCTYDNSKYNPYNPDHNKKIFYGQRVDRSEMCKMNITYVNI